MADINKPKVRHKIVRKLTTKYKKLAKETQTVRQQLHPQQKLTKIKS